MTSGSRALGEVHAGVKQDMVEAVADFSAGTLKQLVGAIVALNFDNTEELPIITPDIKDPQDELKMEKRDEIPFAQMKLPVASQYLYERTTSQRRKPQTRSKRPRWSRRH
jgi:phage gp29-like protein